MLRSLGIIISTVFITFASSAKATEERPYNRKGESEPSSEQIWTVYDHKTFRESELCRVLNCRKRDYCLVKGEDAICLNRKLLRDVPGHKVFFHKITERDESDASVVRHPVRQSVSKQRHRQVILQQPSSRPAAIAEPTTAPLQPPIHQAAGGGGKKHKQKQHQLEDINSAVEWDPDRVRQKLATYYRSVKRKEMNRAALSRKNLYDIPKTFRENSKDDNDADAEQHRARIGGKRRCTHEQLLDIGARLVQWFSDMQTHHEWNSRAHVPQRAHMRACRREARWMFTQLDHDSNEILDPDELYALTYDQYEPCVKPFLDQCDKNVDAHLSIHEWCLCFK